MSQQLNIGLFGFGVVGEGIYNVLKATPSLGAVVKQIVIKHPNKARTISSDYFTTEKDEILSNQDIDIIVELIDNVEEAYEIVKTALENGKHVVTANKKMLAYNLDELIQIAKQNNVSLLYEAAVCGSLPIIRNLEEYYDNDLLTSVKGIINGSTNYILTQIIQKQLSYKEALLEAQDLGFAESNPHLDVSGQDAVNKLAILIKHAYGIIVYPNTIIRKGIAHIQNTDIQYAKEKGYAIKLVAQVHLKDNQQIIATVLPTFIKNDNPLFNIHNEQNGVLIGSSFADEQFIAGKGAGRYPTASAVLSDIAALRYGYQYEYKKSNLYAYNLFNDENIKIYVSYESPTFIATNLFKRIDVQYHSDDRNYIIGKISLQDLAVSGWLEDEAVSIIEFWPEKKNQNLYERHLEELEHINDSK